VKSLYYSSKIDKEKGMTASFRLSAFGDEIAIDLAEQLKTLTDLNVRGLDLRSAWGKNVARLEDEDVARVKQVCAEFGVKIACLGSPLGKSPLAAPLEMEKNNLARLMAIGKMLDTRFIRIFSFYPEDTSTNEHYDAFVEEAAQRLSELAGMAEKEGIILVLEDEKGIVTDTPARCQAVLNKVSSPALRFAWDPANFIQVGVEKPMDHGWAGLQPFVSYVHIKDAMLADGRVVPAGEGDGQLRELLTRLKAMDYQGILSLEPHLKIAGHSSGFSGAEGMTIAAAALRKVMAETGCQEVW
jgi:sugar phosphate isomerase/epimerase